MAKFRIASYYTFGDMNYFLLFLVQYRQRNDDKTVARLHEWMKPKLVSFNFSSTDRVQSTEYRVQTESDAYEPTVQFAQVGSKTEGLIHRGTLLLYPKNL